MLKQQIQDDVKEALKKGEAFTTTILRGLLSSVAAKEKEKRYTIAKEKPDLAEDVLIKESTFSDEEILNVVSSEIKKRRDAITLYEKGNRPELAENEKKEITVLQQYLPEQLSPEALRELVASSIKKTGATEMKDMGKIMADLMPQVKGKAENSEISKIVKELLSK